MKSGTPLTATTVGQFLKAVVGAPWPEFMSEERAAELAAKDCKQVHAILRKAFGEPEEELNDWLGCILAAENAAHQAFFGQTFDLDFFKQTLESYGEDQIRDWAKLELEPHFLPEMAFRPELSLPGWKVKPNDWYWQQLVLGKLKCRNNQGELTKATEARLGGIVVLIDTRLKPKCQGGKQMFAHDKGFMGEIISDLRESGLINRCQSGPQSSRFGVSANEWQEHIRPRVAEKLKLETNQVRLELALEANVIPQLYPSMARAKDGTTDTWVWYEEYFESLSCRLDGGLSSSGGLADVGWGSSDDHWNRKAVRPLGVLAVPLPLGA